MVGGHDLLVLLERPGEDLVLDLVGDLLVDRAAVVEHRLAPLRWFVTCVMNPSTEEPRAGRHKNGPARKPGGAARAEKIYLKTTSEEEYLQVVPSAPEPILVGSLPLELPVNRVHTTRDLSPTIVTFEKVAVSP